MQLVMMIYAIDIYYKNKCVFYKANEMVTDRVGLRFGIDILSTVLIPIEDAEKSGRDLADELKLSWIVVDKSMQCRALNISGWRALSVSPAGKVSAGETIVLSYAKDLSGRRRGEEVFVRCTVEVMGIVVEEEKEEGVTTKVINVWWVSLKMKEIKEEDRLEVLQRAMSIEFSKRRKMERRFLKLLRYGCLLIL